MDEVTGVERGLLDKLLDTPYVVRIYDRTFVHV